MRTRSSRQRWIEGVIIVAFWLFMFLLTAGQRAIDPHGPEGLAPQELLHTGLEYLVWLLLTPGIFWLSHQFSFEGGVWFKRVLLHLGIALLVGIGVDFFSRGTLYLLFPDLPARFFDLTRAVIGLRFLDELLIYLGVLAAGFARSYFLRYQAHQEEATLLRTQAAQLQAKLAEARLQSLRMQVNPHFLFNTLHAISSLVERDPRGVRRMIARLSDLLRYTLEGSSEQEVPLQQELQFLEGYLEIQRIRFQGVLDVREDIDPSLLSALVPNLILQPLVENAIKHGVSRVEGKGKLELRAWRAGNQLVLSVRDNGPGLSDTEEGSSSWFERGVGLRNTRERLERLYGDEQKLSFLEAEGGGVEAVIVLPYHTSADLRTTAIPLLN